MTTEPTSGSLKESLKRIGGKRLRVRNVQSGKRLQVELRGTVVELQEQGWGERTLLLLPVEWIELARSSRRDPHRLWLLKKPTVRLEAKEAQLRIEFFAPSLRTLEAFESRVEDAKERVVGDAGFPAGTAHGLLREHPVRRVLRRAGLLLVPAIITRDAKWLWLLVIPLFLEAFLLSRLLFEPPHLRRAAWASYRNLPALALEHLNRLLASRAASLSDDAKLQLLEAAAELRLELEDFEGALDSAAAIQNIEAGLAQELQTRILSAQRLYRRAEEDPEQ